MNLGLIKLLYFGLGYDVLPISYPFYSSQIMLMSFRSVKSCEDFSVSTVCLSIIIAF
jgi:hypothetical protein